MTATHSCKVSPDGQCVESDTWCQFFRPGRVIINSITSDDIGIKTYPDGTQRDVYDY
jgi:hypothetical protein